MNCHVCGLPYKQVRKSPKVMRCASCEHRYRVPHVDTLEYHLDCYRTQSCHYKDKGEFDKDGNVTPKFHTARQKISDERVQRIRSHLFKEWRFKEWGCLDIGSGGGTFAKALKPFVKSVTCTELHKNLAAECKRQGFETHQGNFAEVVIPDRYELVTSWHVLEHIENVTQFILKAKLFAEKMIVIEVPYKRRMRTNKDYDGHLHYFSEKSFQLLLESCGLKIVTLDEGVQKPAILAICIPT